MPRILALIAVHRQTAASRSTKPSMRLQQGVLAGVPTTRCTRSFNKLAQTPSFRVSLGQEALGFGGEWWWWWCFFGGGGGHGT
ncbi:hypothetical protein ACHQM5_016281 [Ranunculus cassubicifolius]